MNLLTKNYSDQYSGKNSGESFRFLFFEKSKFLIVCSKNIFKGQTKNFDLFNKKKFENSHRWNFQNIGQKKIGQKNHKI